MFRADAARVIWAASFFSMLLESNPARMPTTTTNGRSTILDHAKHMETPSIQGTQTDQHQHTARFLASLETTYGRITSPVVSPADGQMRRQCLEKAKAIEGKTSWNESDALRRGFYMSEALAADSRTLAESTLDLAAAATAVVLKEMKLTPNDAPTLLFGKTDQAAQDLIEARMCAKSLAADFQLQQRESEERIAALEKQLAEQIDLAAVAQQLVDEQSSAIEVAGKELTTVKAESECTIAKLNEELLQARTELQTARAQKASTSPVTDQSAQIAKLTAELAQAKKESAGYSDKLKAALAEIGSSSKSQLDGEAYEFFMALLKHVKIESIEGRALSECLDRKLAGLAT